MTAARSLARSTCLAVPRLGNRPSHAGRIVGDEALIELELIPGDVALVLILEQHVPLRSRGALRGGWSAALDNAELAPVRPNA